MGKIYLDKENRIVLKTDSYSFRSDGSNELKFNDNEKFVMDADTASKLFVIFNDGIFRRLIDKEIKEYDMTRYSCFMCGNTLHLSTTDESVKEISDKLESAQQDLCDKRTSITRLHDNVYELKQKIREHNELPWYARFKKIDLDD